MHDQPYRVDFPNPAVVVSVKFAFFLRGNQAAGVVDGAADEGIAGVEGALRFDVDD